MERLRRFPLLLILLTVSSTHLVGDDSGVTDLPPPPKAELKQGTWTDVQKYIAKHPGQVIVVDIWSTSCLPCMTEFPNLVKLQKQHGKKIACVSVNVDYVGIKSKPPSRYVAKAQKFLTSRQAGFRNYLMTTESDEFFKEIKLNSIPAVFVYGKDGKLAKRFDDSLMTPDKEEPFTYKDDINPFVAALIRK